MSHDPITYDALGFAALAKIEKDRIKGQRMREAQVREALARCGFTEGLIDGQKDIVNARGERLNDDEMKEMIEQLKIVMAETEIARIDMEKEVEAKRSEMEAKAKQEYEDRAKPYREARRAKKLEYLKKQGITK